MAKQDSNRGGIDWQQPKTTDLPPVQVTAPTPTYQPAGQIAAGGDYAQTLCDLGFCTPPTSQVGRYVSNGSRSGILRDMPVGESVADALALNRIARMSGFNSYGDALTGAREGQFTQSQGTPEWQDQFEQGVGAGLSPTSAAAAANAAVTVANPNLGAGYTSRQAAADEAQQEATANRLAGTASALNLPGLAGLGYYGGNQYLSTSGVQDVTAQNGQPYITTAGGANVGLPSNSLREVLSIPSSSAQGGILGQNALMRKTASDLFNAEINRLKARNTAQAATNRAYAATNKRLAKELKAPIDAGSL